jgi:hypothetical protein
MQAPTGPPRRGRTTTRRRARSCFPGTTRLWIEVPIWDDLLLEGEESVLVDFSNVEEAVMPVTQAVGTILDDD